MNNHQQNGLLRSACSHSDCSWKYGFVALIMHAHLFSGTHQRIKKNFNCVWDAEEDAAGALGLSPWIILLLNTLYALLSLWPITRYRCIYLVFSNFVFSLDLLEISRDILPTPQSPTLCFAHPVLFMARLFFVNKSSLGRPVSWRVSQATVGKPDKAFPL